MHKNLNVKYKESATIISSLEIKNSVLTSKLNKMPSNTDEQNEKDNLISSLKCQLENLSDEMRSLRSENYYLTSRLQSVDDISNNMDSLKTKNIELKNIHQDLL